MKTPWNTSRIIRSGMLVLPALCAGFAAGLLFDRPAAERSPEAATRSTATLSATHGSSRSSLPERELVAPLDRLKRLAMESATTDPSELLAAIRELSGSECPQALHVIQRNRTEHTRLFLDALAARWSHVDPAGAFVAAQNERADNDWRNRLGSAAGAALATTDPTAALDRIARAKLRWDREKAAEWILPALAKTDPKRAANFLASDPRLARHNHIFREVARAYGKYSPQEAIAWAESLRVGSGEWIVHSA